MRHLGAAVIALAAVLGALANPIVVSGPSDVTPVGIALMVTGFYVVVPLALLGPIGYTFRVLGTRPLAEEWRMRVALGEPAATLVGEQARRGAIAGVWASGAGALVGTALQTLLMPVIAGQSPRVSVVGLAGIVVTLALTIGTTTAAYALAAGRAAATPARATAAQALETPPSAREARVRAWMWRGLAVVVGLAGVVALWDRLWFARDDVAGTGFAWWWNAVGIARGVLVLGGLVLLVRVVAISGAALSARAATPLSHRAAGPAAQVAADGLRRRSRIRVLAAGTIGAVLLASAWLATVIPVDMARDAVADALSPPLVVASTDTMVVEDAPPGFDRREMPAEEIATILDDPRVIAVPFALLRGEASGYQVISEDGESWRELQQTQVLVVDPADLARVAPDGLRPLGLQDGTVTSGRFGVTVGEVMGGTVGAVARIPLTASTLEAFVLNGLAFDTFGTRAWAEAQLGEAPVTGVLLWPAEGVTVSELDAAATEILEDPGLTWWHLGGDASISIGMVGDLGTLVLLALLLAIGIALTTSLAIATARDRRADLATLQALGANPRSLRWAPAIEVMVTVLAAAAVAIPMGVVLGVVGAHPTLLHAGAPLDAVETLWGLWWELGHVGWAVPLVLAAGAAACGAVAAGAVGWRLMRGAPVEQLREAQKEGVL